MKKKSANLPRLVATTILVSCAMSAPAAQAQESDGQTAAAEDDGEIIVTAQKRSESVNDVPMSISAISGDALARRGVVDTADLAKFVPGFTFNTDPRGAVVYTIRGIGFQENTLAASPSVTVYVDEIPLPYAVETLGASLDLERVEVLKGPQGTLYGQNSTGGLVNYIAAKPLEALGAGATLRYGRFNTTDIAGYFSGPISDTLRVRLSARSLRGDAWQRSYTRVDEMGRRNQLYGRLLAEWTPTDRLTIMLNLNGWRDRSEMQASQLIQVSPQVSNPARAFAPMNDYPLAPASNRAADWTPGNDYTRNNRFYQASLRADYDLTDTVKLTSLSSYQRFKMFMPMDNDGVSFENFGYIRNGDIETFFQELRLSGDLAGGNWILGANYQHDDTFESALGLFAQSSQRILGGTIVNENGQIVKTYSVYGSVDIPLTDTLSLTGGLRYTKQDIDYAGCTRDAGDGLLAAAFNLSSGVPGRFQTGGCISSDAAGLPVFVRSELNEDNLSWRAGINFKPNDDLLFYGNVARGYKAGSFPTLSAARAGQLEPVTQESVLAYEAGFKMTLLDRVLQVNGAAFYYDYSDKQTRARRDLPPFGALEGLVNIPKSHVAGFEAEVVWRPIAGLTLNQSVTYTKSEIDGSFINFPASGFPPAVQLAGEPFPYTPKWMANTDVEYRWPLSSTIEAYAGANVSTRSATNGGLGQLPVFGIRGYTLLDLRAGIESADGRWNVGIWGQNVTNRYYWLSAGRIQDALTRTTGMPATYGVSIGWHY